MDQPVSDAFPHLPGFEDNDARVSMGGGQGAAVGAAPGMQPERPVMRPERQVELTLARLDPHLVAIHEMDPQAVSQFTRLAISLISGSARRTLKRVLLTSAHSGEGRSCVALNLAAGGGGGRRWRGRASARWSSTPISSGLRSGACWDLNRRSDWPKRSRSTCNQRRPLFGSCPPIFTSC
jgi:hypothetical protein